MAATDPDVQRPGAKRTAETADPTPGVGAALVYVVDDEPLVGEVVQAVLESAGFRTRLFQDPAVALQSLAQATSRPQLLLTDFKMRSMNGMELIQGCKMIHPPLKTVLFSSTLEPEDLRPYPVQPDQLVCKPLPPQRLPALMENLLRAKR